jgi:hypothetical protein
MTGTKTGDSTDSILSKSPASITKHEANAPKANDTASRRIRRPNCQIPKANGIHNPYQLKTKSLANFPTSED